MCDEDYMTLSELPAFASAVVMDVRDIVSDSGGKDVIGQRLRELGFVKGEPVRVVGRGPIGADPLLVQIGFTRFALRRSEADRITVSRDA